ncbi:MAG: aldehyde dehydrogenase family protein [Deltaproteobacteria bacterium]|nr:aldehyde dehydrogenase family protein [Deltaproteobacteria bacterium]
MTSRYLSGFKNEPLLNPWENDEKRKWLLNGIDEARKILKTPPQQQSAGTFTTINPNDKNEKFGPFPITSESQALEAMERAKKIQPAWGNRPHQERADLMRKISKKTQEHKWIIMGLLMLESGKTAVEAYADWAEGVDFLEYYASACELIHDPEFLGITSLPAHATRMHPKPIGIGLSLPPFNFPFAIFAGMWAAPTVMGNVVIVKPSPRGPASGIFMTKLIQEAGAPIELVLDGPGSNKVGELLVKHPDIALITFTGSRKAGWEINKAAAETSVKWIKRVVAEMGGCDFIAVHDFEDLHVLVDAVQASALGFQGQKCSALSRLIVKEDIYDKVKQAVVERLKNIRLQNVTDPSAVLGGVIDRQAFKTILDQCAAVQKAGATFLLGGKADEDFPGFGILPSLHEGLKPSQEEAGMEIFGPVFGIYKAKNFDEMVQIANSTPYALTGALFTTKPELKKRAAEFSAGNMYLNRKCTGAFVGAEPFGGWYGSGTDDKAGHWSHLLRFIHWQTISEKL